MMKVATYLEFKFNAKEVIETYKEIIDAKVVCEYFFTGDMTQNQELVGKVFHAELVIGDLNLYVCDSGRDASFPSMKFVVEIGEEDVARQFLANLVKSGTLISDFKKMPIGPIIAEAEDKFGIRWDIVIC